MRVPTAIAKLGIAALAGLCLSPRLPVAAVSGRQQQCSNSLGSNPAGGVDSVMDALAGGGPLNASDR